MEVHIQIKNLPQIRAAFGAAPKIIGDRVSKVIRDMTFLIEGRSKILTPVRTGFLRNSHVTRFMGSGMGFRGEIEPTAHYALFVHEGTRFMRGRPFLRKAAEQSTGDIDTAFGNALQEGLNEIGRRT